MKKLKYSLITIGVLFIYLIIGLCFNIYLPCPIHKITGLYCPGCGLTRMILSLLRFDFYQAFRYNPYLFICLPIAIALYIEHIYCTFKHKKSIYEKTPIFVWIILIIITISFAVLRNIFPYLAPTLIK